MAIMAWDHVSSFWNRYHHGGEGILGQAPPFRDTVWFLERFVSHVCAPSFIFLAGTVLAISTSRRLDKGHSQREISIHLIKRGIVLLVLEALVVAPAFDLPRTYFGVIACIGICLIIFSVYRRVPPFMILGLSLLIILNHRFLNLDFIPPDTAWGWYARVIIHEPNFNWIPWVGLYPIIPWIGVMGLGWSFGTFLTYLNTHEIDRLKIPLSLAGIVSIILFFIVRWNNGYGNLLVRKGTSIIDWLYVSKYPPSIAFLLWTLGWMSVLFALGLFLKNQSRIEKGFSGVILAFGKNPLFFYLVHLWLYKGRLPYTPKTFYLEMWQTFIFWVVGLVVLWQLCIRYEKIKRKYPRWLQYI
jgi:uncharacterized membrane protein